MIKGIRINKSKIVHLYHAATDRTDCGAGGMDSVSANGGTATSDAVTCKRCLKALAGQAERDHAEALELDAQLEQEAAEVAQLLAETAAQAETAIELARDADAHWILGDDALWRAADRVLLHCDVTVSKRHPSHEGPCFDSVASTWRVEPVTAKRSRRQGRAERRSLRAKLRRTAPQTRAAARARRAQRGDARATAKTLLVATGVPQDVAQRYAPAFSRGVEAATVLTRVQTGEHRSKRVEVKRYAWCQFVARLATYRPAAHEPHLYFERAASRVRKMALQSTSGLVWIDELAGMPA
jgi:hypothetical protein